MKNTLHITQSGDWWVERPHATGSDIGPAHYGTKPAGCDADTQIAYYKKAGFVIDDRRVDAHHAASCKAHDFAASLTRAQLIKVCEWNDSNGCFNDEASLLEFDRVATDDELRAILIGWLTEDPTETEAQIKLFEAHK